MDLDPGNAATSFSETRMKSMKEEGLQLVRSRGMEARAARGHDVTRRDGISALKSSHELLSISGAT